MKVKYMGAIQVEIGHFGEKNKADQNILNLMKKYLIYSIIVRKVILPLNGPLKCLKANDL